MKRKLLTTLLSLSLIALAIPAFATIKTFDSEFGPDTTTRDTDTGLEWLDLSVTVGDSWDSMQPKLMPGGEYYGWRHASSAEFSQFLENAGGSYGFMNVPSTILAFMDLVTISYTIGAPGDAFYRRATNGILGEVSSPGWHQIAGGTVDMDGEVFTYNVFSTSWGGASDSFGSDFGHWLVRSGRVVSNQDSSWGEIKSLFR